MPTFSPTVKRVQFPALLNYSSASILPTLEIVGASLSWKTKKSHPYNGWDTHVRTLKNTVPDSQRESCDYVAQGGQPGEPLVRPIPDSSYTIPFREGFGDTCKVGLLALDHQLPFLSSPAMRVTWIKKGFTITVAGPLGTFTRFPVTSCFTQEHLACFHQYCLHNNTAQEIMSMLMILVSSSIFRQNRKKS